MTIGLSPQHEDLFSSTKFCAEYLSETSIYRLLHDEGQRLFPDAEFADLFDRRGRCAVAPRIFATVMILQRIEGLSDREAVERFQYDLRWKYAAGGLPVEYPSFCHTVLVDVRARLRASTRPNRIFDAMLEVAKAAGLVGRRRVLDSTALYDAVATQDTVLMIRSAIRGLLHVADASLVTELRSVLQRDDDYSTPGKPSCDWDDKAARDALINALHRDGTALLKLLHQRQLSDEVQRAVTLLATVLGQDVDIDEDGTVRIAQRVAPDRLISTVDPEARHGHKTASRHFDGYKAHLALDPDSEIITATEVTAGNVGDGEVAEALLSDLLSRPKKDAPKSEEEVPPGGGSAGPPEPPSTPPSDLAAQAAAEPAASVALSSAPTAVAVAPTTTTSATEDATTEPSDAAASTTPNAVTGEAAEEPPEAYGDASYGLADLIERCEADGIEVYLKVQVPSGRQGRFTQEAFTILEDDADGVGHVRCPAGNTVPLVPRKDGSRIASFGEHCQNCPLRAQCTEARNGRGIHLHPKHKTLSRHRQRQRESRWKQQYRAVRPKIERKIGQLMHRKHGGRRARMRGHLRVGHDFALLAAGANLKRFATLKLRWTSGGWRCGV